MIIQNNAHLYINKFNSSLYLTAEEELNLLTQFNTTGNEKFLENIILSHLRLVHKLARQYSYSNTEIDDLIQEGTIGLIKAAQNFDSTKGFRFSTYARWWVRSAILEYRVQNHSLVKIGTTQAQRKIYFNLQKVKHKLNLSDIKCFTPLELKTIAKELEVTEHEILDMHSRLTQTDMSLNTPANIEDEDTEILDYVEAREIAHDILYIEKQDKQQKQRLLNQAMNLLSKRERDILIARRLQETPQTLEDLAAQYNISRERIRQIENRVIEKLQDFVKI